MTKKEANITKHKDESSDGCDHQRDNNDQDASNDDCNELDKKCANKNTSKEIDADDVILGDDGQESGDKKSIVKESSREKSSSSISGAVKKESRDDNNTSKEGDDDVKDSVDETKNSITTRPDTIASSASSSSVMGVGATASWNSQSDNDNVNLSLTSSSSTTSTTTAFKQHHPSHPNTAQYPTIQPALHRLDRYTTIRVMFCQ